MYKLIFLIMIFSFSTLFGEPQKRVAYIVSDIRIPFWNIMARGIESKGAELGYSVTVHSANNSRKQELINSVQAIKSGVDGVIVSPTTSSACVTLLRLAERENIPVVISDIGTDGGDYVSYISSDNFEGAYQIGRVLVKKMLELKISDGTVGIISIPQKRDNGKARTSGFMKALNESAIKGSGLRQQVDFSYEETYNHSIDLIKGDKNLKALWLQGSDRYKGALDAIRDSGKDGEILLLTFDAEPIFLDLIPQGVLVGAAMQQPFLMGEMAVETLDKHLKGERVEKHQMLNILAISNENIEKQLPIIKRNVLGITVE